MIADADTHEEIMIKDGEYAHYTTFERAHLWIVRVLELPSQHVGVAGRCPGTPT